ncbi:hypothetical protein JTB14_005153 [Gonioctena quinquepunctata]|nr:hypothetical protein JTB14_005153 [Gonioctena quinquepunctata]
MEEAEQNTCTSEKNNNVQEKENTEEELLPVAELSQASRTSEMTRLEDDEEPFSGTSSGSMYQPQSNNSVSEEEHSQYEKENLREDQNDSFKIKDAERAHTSILPERPKRGCQNEPKSVSS